ncbi:TPA: DinB family protein, partial [Enterococcus faecium]|nr:DinB family protein [Enterococcus faecium]
GPMSIAWLMWHIIYWWSTALDYNFGNGSIKKEDITWPGSIENAKEVIESLHEKWVSKLSELSDGELLMKHNAKWPLDERNFADTALWLNAELMKNAAEIGYARFLYGNSMKQK